MIIRPTVFVLGAGASAAYWFPLGPKLVADICTDLGESETPNNAVSTLCKASGIDAERFYQFRRDLLDSARTSIDAFIETRGETYDLVGRLAIAQRLLRAELDIHLRPDQSADWCGYLLGAILGNSPQQFLSNRLKVITFNFDRSFERKLFLAVQANYPHADVAALVASIPVLHIHGQLGRPHWLPSDGTVWTRPYTNSADPDIIRQCAEQIHIVHHTIDDETLTAARQWLNEVDRICFLGFSYHELNLAKLDVVNLSAKQRIECVGTSFGIEPGPFNKIQRLLDGKVALLAPTHDIMSYLRTAAYLFD